MLFFTAAAPPASPQTEELLSSAFLPQYKELMFPPSFYLPSPPFTSRRLVLLLLPTRRPPLCVCVCSCKALEVFPLYIPEYLR